MYLLSNEYIVDEIGGRDWEVMQRGASLYDITEWRTEYVAVQ